MRTIAIAVLISMCHVPLAIAGDTLREAAVRAADRAAAADAAAVRANRHNPATAPRFGPPAAGRADAGRGRKPKASFQQGPRGLEEAGIGTGMKVLIGLGVAAALGGIMLSIDGRVEDNTPSTRGERTNEPF